jgi:hypothetical protein
MAALTLLFQMICWLLLLGIVIGAFFLWINNKAREEEEKSYSKDFNYKTGISKQYSEHIEPEEPDPLIALKKYKVPQAPISAGSQKSKGKLKSATPQKEPEGPAPVKGEPEDSES